MVNWMSVLSRHYEKTRKQYPEDKLMIMFDIDGTIIDMRYLIHYLLSQYDEINGTSHFDGLNLKDITVHENHVDSLLEQMDIPPSERKRIFEFWTERRWATDSLMKSHLPFAGVFEIIRWFQMQHNLVVSLNTGRPEHLREDTLRSLNALGRDYNVRFASEFLHMNPQGWDQGIPASKAEGVRKFQRDGYRVFAMVDNEPEYLMAVCELDESGDLLALHANTIFESDRGDYPCCEVSGSDYVLSDLASEDTLPQEVDFVWHGVNEKANLRQFLGSDVRWGEIDVRPNPDSGTLVLHHDRLYSHPETEQTLDLEYAIQEFNRFDKSFKLDFKEGQATIDRALGILANEEVDGSRLWFTGTVDVVKAEGFKKLRQAYPSAVVQSTIDYLAERIAADPDSAREILEEHHGWGVNRYSINWEVPQLKLIIDRLSSCGFEVDVYGVPDLDVFLKTVLLAPRSVTSDFNFPQWHYFGRGAGKDGEYFSYSAQGLSTDS
ncbi:MAG: hypothetical protein IIB17_08050 [Chloroflexi bacterium]|nr:hypothetical protein [Chloroflexota bacterium]